jgi:hypothetical protein
MANKPQDDFDVDSFLADESAGETPMPTPPSPGMVQEAIAPVYGTAAALGNIAEEHPWATGLAAAGAAKALGSIPGVSPTVGRVAQAVVPGYGFARDIATGAVNAAKDFAGHYGARNAAFDNRTFQSMLNKAATMEMKGEVGGQAYKNLVEEIDRMKALRAAASAPVSPASTGMNTAQQGINNMIRGGAQNAAAGAAETAAPQAGRFAQMAQRLAPVGRFLGAAATPFAVADTGYDLSKMATNTLRGMTPEMRDMMMGDVGSDTAFAAAILNSAGKQQEINDRIRQAAAAKALRPVAPTTPPGQ